MPKYIANPAIHLNLALKLEQNQRGNLSRGPDPRLFRTCTKRMMICWPGPPSRLGSSRLKKGKKIAVQNATEEFLRPKKWLQHRDHGITRTASVAWTVLV